MKTAVQHLEELSKDDKLRMIAEARQKEIMDRHSFLQDSYDEGWEKGHQKGQKEGHQKGLQKGRQERDREVVLNMLQNNLSVSLISKATGLSKEEIKKMKNNSS